MSDEMKAKCGRPLYWHNCYKGSQDLYHSDAFQHPAKMAIPLAFRIMEHLKELGLLKDEDVVLDPMSGISTTGIVASALGHKFIGVELEEKFIELSKKNKEYAERKLYKGFDWQLIKGDSRRLSDLLKGQGLKSITSPPYAEQPSPDRTDYGILRHKEDCQCNFCRKNKGNKGMIQGYRQVKDTPLKSITSPPYQDSQGHPSLGSVNKDDWGKEGKDIVKRRGLSGEYGESEGQVGNLKSITSPPYSEAQSGGGIAKKGYTGSKHSPTDLVGKRSYMPEVHGQSEGQIANLKDTPLKSIVSPPYGETGVGDWKTGRAEFQAWVINEIKTKGYVEWQGKRYTETEWRAMNHGRIDGRTTKGVNKISTDGYSDNPDNIGGLPDKTLKAITSPPYEQSITGGKSGIEWQEEWGKPSESRQPSQDISYGESKENIGNLKDKPLKSIVSPPYGDLEKRDRSIEPHYEKEKNYPRGDHNIDAGYQGSDDNIGKLADKPLKSVMSPPHGLGKGIGHADKKRETRAILKDRNVNLAYNDENPDNIGNLADKPLKSIVSPPYLADDQRQTRHISSEKSDEKRGYKPIGGFRQYYSQSPENIGNPQGVKADESYLEAMLKVYREISLVSDVLCVVVKNPTRAGHLRRLDLDTISILEASGWRIHCQHRALLFEELEQADMFEGSKKQVKGRLSFFKRLSWQNGQPVANFEDIIIAVRK